MTDIQLVDKDEVIEENSIQENIDRKIPTWKRHGFNSRLEWADHNAHLEGYTSEAEKYKIKRWEQGKKVPLEIKGTTSNKGFEMESYLSVIFGKLEKTPYGNENYDFICRRDGKKIEVKRREKSQNNSFDFTHINYNKEADIHILVGLIDDVPVKLWKFDREDLMHDGLPFWGRERWQLYDTHIGYYTKYELPTKLEDLKKLVKDVVQPHNISEIICREKGLINNKKESIIDAVLFGNKKIAYRTVHLELQIMQRLLSEYRKFDEDSVNIAEKDRDTGKHVYYNLVAKKDGKDIKISHHGCNLQTDKNGYQRYSLAVDYNNKADYLLFSLWESRNSLRPLKVLFIHKDEIIRGNKLCSKSAISLTKISEFDRFNILPLEQESLEKY